MSDSISNWSERSQILSYALGLPMSDWDFHPEEPDRPLFKQHRNSFPLETDATAPEFELSSESLAAVQQTLGDISMWKDLEDLLGEEAVAKAKERMQELVKSK